MQNKKSFVLPKSLIQEIGALTNEEAGTLFKAVLAFVNGLPFYVHDDAWPLFDKITNFIKDEWGKYNPKNGKFHWNYKGGITPENKLARNSINNELWRLGVFERDDYTCQNCGQRGGKLHAHHIKPFATFPALRFVLSNGQTLCETCHRNAHKKPSL